jgi:hypothetical protein
LSSKSTVHTDLSVRETAHALMIDSVEIRNFRGFRDVRASNLGRMNIVVGDNRSGKTAFLEALFLACGNTPENPIKLRRWRGIYSDNLIAISFNDMAAGEPWRDLFFGFDIKNTIAIDVRGKPNRSLRVEARPPGIPVEPSVIDAPITFVWTDATGALYRSTPRMASGQLTFPNSPPGISGAMINAGAVSPQETANRLSELDRRGDVGPILAAFRTQFPEIEGFSVVASESLAPMVYAAIAGMAAKVPLPLVSAGINRMVSIFLHLASMPRGSALFVDELESGIYYERLPDMWETVNGLSKANDVQVFASLHSGEALDALRTTVQAEPAAFRLVRMNLHGEIEVIQGASLAAAITERVEFR